MDHNLIWLISPSQSWWIRLMMFDAYPENKRKSLRDVVTQALVVAYKEDVTSLVSSLAVEGFDVEVLRSDYTNQEMAYSRASRAFLNHRNAWRRAIGNSGYTLICEADFVPCRGIGGFEVFWPFENTSAWGYLYQGSPRLIAVVGSQGFLRGHAAPTVCYVVNGTVASFMLSFFDDQSRKYDLRSYFTFEAHMQWYLMGLGAEAFLPRRHYGEHGGLPNPEHATSGLTGNRGEHRADNLMSSLHFLPAYANNSYLTFFWTRFVAHLKGFGRLVTGRWIVETNVYNYDILDRIKMHLIGFRRLLSLPL